MVAIVWVDTTFRTGLLLFPLLFIAITMTPGVRQHLLCLSDPKAMARAQKLQEWYWEMEKGHGGTTHILQIASLHVKQLMFYPHDWDLAFYSIFQMYGVHFKQPMFYILEWVLVLYHIL